MKKLNGSELLEIVSEVNSYCNDLSEYDFYDMDMLDDLFFGKAPSEILLMVSNEFNIFDDYFKFNGYGHLISYREYEAIRELEEDREYILEVYEDIKEFL